MTSGVRFGESMQGSGIGTRVMHHDGLEKHARALLRGLGFTSTVFYPNHVMPALIAKAKTPEELDRWHAVASAAVGEIKYIGRTLFQSLTIYSKFKWEAWKGIIEQAATPEQLQSLISAWRQNNKAYLQPR